jgi:hypothetical protein
MEISHSVKTASPNLQSSPKLSNGQLNIESGSFRSEVSNETDKMSFTLDMAKIAYGPTSQPFDDDQSCLEKFSFPIKKGPSHWVNDSSTKNKDSPNKDAYGDKNENFICKYDGRRTSTPETCLDYDKDMTNDNASMESETPAPEAVIKVTTKEYKQILKKFVRYAILT